MSELIVTGPDMPEDTGAVTRRENAVKLVAKYARLVEINDSNESEGTEALRQAKKLRTAIETDRKSYVKPLNDTVKRINLQFKKMTEPLDDVIAHLSDLSLRHMKRKKAEAEKLAREEAERLRRESEAQLELAATKGDELALDTAEQAAEQADKIARAKVKPRVTGSMGATTYVTRRRSFEVVDVTKMPARYLSVNTRVLRAELSSIPDSEFDAKSEKRIPGVRLVWDESVASR